jgi:hypothetical protein
MDPLVLGAISLSAIAVAIDYSIVVKGPITRTPTFDQQSRNLYAATYVGMPPGFA